MSADAREIALRIGGNLRALRDARALSVAQVARLAGVRPSEIEEWEAADGLGSPVALGRLAHFYGVSVPLLSSPAFQDAAPAMLRTRPDVQAADLGGWIAAGLLIARAWRELWLSLRASPEDTRATPPDDYSPDRLPRLRDILSRISREADAYAHAVREFFGYSSTERFHVQERAYSLGAVTVVLFLPEGAGFDGCYQQIPDGWSVILVNGRERPPAHFSFVVAHELMHFIDGDIEFEFTRREDRRASETERFCDEFADHLILPLAAVRQYACGTADRLDSALRDASKKFMASRATIGRQFSRAGHGTPEKIMRRCTELRLYPVKQREVPTTPALPKAFKQLLSEGLEKGIISTRRVNELETLLTGSIAR